MKVNIDKKSGFCFGVLNAIKTAEEFLDKYGTLFCLGDIVHNNKEVNRLKEKGLITIDHNDLKDLYNTRVLIRAHGEPPQTYQAAKENNLEIIDASCPVVLKLQNRISVSQQEALEANGQLVIFGKEGHAEVVGLKGYTADKAIVVGNNPDDLKKIDFSRPITLYSQTTQNKEEYRLLAAKIKQMLAEHHCGKSEAPGLKVYNTICGQVSNRGPHLAGFAKQHDLVIFVSGKKSSNGKYLFEICRSHNPNTYFVSGKEELQKDWLTGVSSTGVCGATSTPMWLMEEVAEEIKTLKHGL